MGELYVGLETATTCKEVPKYLLFLMWVLMGTFGEYIYRVLTLGVIN